MTRGAPNIRHLTIAQEALLVIIANPRGTAKVTRTRIINRAHPIAQTTTRDYGARGLIILFRGRASPELGDGVLNCVHQLLQRAAPPLLLLLFGGGGATVAGERGGSRRLSVVCEAALLQVVVVEEEEVTVDHGGAALLADAVWRGRGGAVNGCGEEVAGGGGGVRVRALGQSVVGVRHGRGAAEWVEHEWALVDRVADFADGGAVLDEELDDDALLVYVEVVALVEFGVDDVGREADGQVEWVHFVGGLLEGDALEEAHEVDEDVEVELGQLEAEVEDGVEFGLGCVQFDGLDEVGVEGEGEQGLGQLAEELLEQAGHVEDGELLEVVGAVLHLFLGLKRNWGLVKGGGGVGYFQTIHLENPVNRNSFMITTYSF